MDGNSLVGMAWTLGLLVVTDHEDLLWWAIAGLLFFFHLVAHAG